jgi:uncharacterized protein (TIGR02145 family)
MPDGKIWMAENLNWNGAGVYYGNGTTPGNKEPFAKAGRLYTYEEAIAAAPPGWHLPTLDEWETLANAVGGSSTAGTKLKSKSGWNGKSNGTDNFGFSALPGGYCNSAFRNIGSNGYWWSATENNIKNANFCYMNSSAAILRRSGTKSHFYSVRCVQD